MSSGLGNAVIMSPSVSTSYCTPELFGRYTRHREPAGGICPEIIQGFSYNNASRELVLASSISYNLSIGPSADSFDQYLFTPPFPWLRSSSFPNPPTLVDIVGALIEFELLAL
jgi:hypothetical protein